MECLMALYIGQSDFLNNCSTFHLPYYIVYHFNFLQVIIWRISHAHKALVFSHATAINKGLHVQEKETKMKSQNILNKINLFEHILMPLIIPSGFLLWNDAFCFQNCKLEIKRRHSYYEVTFQEYYHMPISYVWLLPEERPTLCVFIF